MKRFPIRLRLTIFFAAGTTVVLSSLGLIIYLHAGAALLDVVDTGLRSRAEVLIADVRTHGPQIVNLSPTLIERDESFAQITDSSGHVLQSSSIVADFPMVPPSRAPSITHPTTFNERIPAV